MASDKDNKDHILVIKLGALGDFVQALGPMAAIRRHHPQAVLTLLTTAPFVPLAESCGFFDHIRTDNRPGLTDIGDWISLRKMLNEGRFTRVYDLQNNDRTSLYFRLLREKPEWVGTVKGASHRNTDLARTAGTGLDGHIQTLALAGIADAALDDLAWAQADLSDLGLPDRYVLLVPGCSPRHPEKRWPAAFFAALAYTLAHEGLTPVLVGTADDAEALRTITAACPEAVDLGGRTVLSALPALARRAAAAVGNDTGPMHLIAPTGCPSCVLFSAHSDPVRHAPQGAAVHIIAVEDLAALSPARVLHEMKLRGPDGQALSHFT